MSGVGAGRDRCLEWERVEIGLYVWSGAGICLGVGAALHLLRPYIYLDFTWIFN